MISSIHGAVKSVTEDSVVVNVNGNFSYEVLIPRFMVRRLMGKVNEPVEFFTYHYMEGGAGGSNLIPRLVGFSTIEEREFFIKFITVPDIGVRKALRCFVISPAEIAGAIENGDLKTLEKLPGIGKRSGQKIIAELGGKVAKYALIISEEEEGEKVHAPASDLKEEVTDALLQLGYNPREAQEMISRALKVTPDITTPEELLAAVYKQRTQGEQS